MAGPLADPKSITAEKLSRLTNAVIVGVSQFDDPALSPLPQCVPEAAKLASMLSFPNACNVPADSVRLLPEQAGGRVTRRDVLDAISQAAGALEPEGFLLLFLASHGWETDGGFAVATTDSRAEQPESGVRAIDIAQRLSATKAGGFVLIADCCGGAGIAETSDGLVQAGPSDFGFRAVMSSASRGEKAWDFEDEGSPFARALTSALEGRMSGIGTRGEIFLGALFDHIQSEVGNYFREAAPGFGQTPRLNSSMARDPLLFVNTDATLRSIEFARSRMSRQAARRMVRRAVAGVAAAVIAAMIAGYTFVDQHRFLATDDEGRIGLYYGHPKAEFLTGRRALWQTAITSRHVDPDSSIAKKGAAAFHKSADPAAVLEGSLNRPGAARLALLNGEAAKASELLGPLTDRPDIEIPIAEHEGRSARLVDLSGHTNTATGLEAIASLARTDPPAFLRARHSKSAGRYHLLDRMPSGTFYAEAGPFDCDAEINALLGLEVGYGVAPVNVARLHLLGRCPISVERAILMAMPGLFAALPGNGIEPSHLIAAADSPRADAVLSFVSGLSKVPCIASATVPDELPDGFVRTEDLKLAGRVTDWMVHAVQSCDAALSVDFDADPAAATFTVRHEGASRSIALPYDAALILSEMRLSRALPPDLALRDLSARLASLDALNDASASNALALVLYELELLAKHPGARAIAKGLDLDRVLPEARLSFLWRAAPARAFEATVGSLANPSVAERRLSIAASHAPIATGTEILAHEAFARAEPATRVPARVLFAEAAEAANALAHPLLELRDVAWRWVCARADLTEVLDLVGTLETELPHGLAERRYRLSVDRMRAQRIASLPVVKGSGRWLWQHMPEEGGCRVLALRSRMEMGDVVSYWEDSGIR